MQLERVTIAKLGTSFGTRFRSHHPSATVGPVTKAELHDLVESLPAESIDAVGRLLRRAQDPVLAKLDAAPYDDEPFADEDRVAVDEAVREPGVSWPDISRELSAD